MGVKGSRARAARAYTLHPHALDAASVRLLAAADLACLLALSDSMDG